MANTILSWLVSSGLTMITVLVAVQLERSEAKIVMIIILTTFSFWAGKVFGFLDGRNKATE